MLTSYNATACGLAATNTAAANTAALQAALDTGRCVHIPRGTFKVAPGLLKKANGQIVFGQGQGQSILKIEGSGDLFNNNGFANTGLESLQINGDPTATSGAVYAAAPGAARYEGGFLRDLRIGSAYNGFWLSGFNNLDIESVEMHDMRGAFGITAYGSSDATRCDILSVRSFTYSLNPAARATQGTALVIDGFVHTVELSSLRAVVPHRGIHISNSPGMVEGKRPAFVLGSMVQVDFPYYDALLAESCARLRMTNGYFHGSEHGSGVVLGADVKNAAVSDTNVTGHFYNGVWVEAEDVDLTNLQLDWNSQAGPGVANGIGLGDSSKRVRIMGGGSKDSQVAFGICKTFAAPVPQVACINDHVGIYGVKNF